MINDKQSISSYVNTRIQNNYLINYGTTDHHSNGIKQTMFYLLYFIISHALDDGNTVLVLKNTPVADKPYQAWQKSVIDFTTTYLNGYLADTLEIDDILKQIDEYQNDNHALQACIAQAQQALKSSYDKSLLLNPIKSDTNSIMHAHYKNHLSDILLWLLRFYFYGQHRLNGDLTAFINGLDYQCFFTNHIEHQDKPIVVYHAGDKAYFWLGRIYKAEKALLTQLQKIRQSPVSPISLGSLNPSLNTEQKQAINTIANHAFSLIIGGPGTGKTFTIAQIVKAIYQSQSSDDSFALALVAPTGKAAQRMAESLQSALQGSSDITLPEPMTIHRLLGMGMRGVPRFHKTNPLPYEMIIVDEASMFGVELATLLLMAVKCGTRVILLGDAHQLSAVDAGAVLADLCRLQMCQNALVRLTQSKRFNSTSGVGRLASFINEDKIHDIGSVLSLIHEETQLSFIDIAKSSLSGVALEEFYQTLTLPYMTDKQTLSFFAFTKYIRHNFYRQTDDEKYQTVKQLMTTFNDYRILTASHLSYWGDNKINDYIRHAHREFLGLPPMQAHYSPWYHGRVVMVLKNRYDLGLFNGDIGICLQSGKKANELSVYFLANELHSFSVGVLDDDMITTAYAMTVHKSQGSEFTNVAVVFHEDNARLLSKELIYTAITRAKNSVSIYSSEKALMQAVNGPTIRQTGLTI